MNIIKGQHYNTDIEAALLGMCLIDTQVFASIRKKISADVFYSPVHKEVFNAYAELFRGNSPIDLLSVADYFQRTKGIMKLNDSPVAYYLTTLTDKVIGSSHKEYYCDVLTTIYLERELIHLTHEENPDIRKKIKDLQTKIHYSNENEWTDMSSLMIGLYEHQGEMNKTKGKGITCGIKELDRDNGGFFKGQFIVIGARPSVGKSALAGQIAIAMARKGKKVGFISLEMNNNEIAGRIAAIDCDIDFKKVYRGLYDDENESKRVYEKISKETINLPIWISDKTSVDIGEIKAKAVNLQRKFGLDCLFIDYLQLVDSDETRNSNRENEIRKISRGIKIMAKELEIPIVCLCQLNRNVTARKGEDRYPHLSDLRESGSLEQDADVVIFLHRDWMSGLEMNEGVSTENEADIVVRKWRNGMSNLIIKMNFEGSKMKFSEPKVNNYVGKDFTETKNPF